MTTEQNSKPEGSRGGAETRSHPTADKKTSALSAAPRAPNPSLDTITGEIVDCAVKLHQSLGPGLLESVYEAILGRDLARRGFKVERQKVLRFHYDGMEFDEGLRLDLLVEGSVIVELKSVEKLAPVHKKQLLTYLRLAGQPAGLLINFGATTLKEGLHRIVNNLPPSASPRLRVNQSEGNLQE